MIYREKMICGILLLLSLTSFFSAGTFVVNVTQTSYQAEENQDVILEWTFTSKPHSELDTLNIFCQMFTELRPFYLFHLSEGVEVPDSQDKQFAGRVQFNKDNLRDGRLRLHVSRLRISDSGRYECDVKTGYGEGSRSCQLNVTETPNKRSQGSDPPPIGSGPQPADPLKILLYCGLGLFLLLSA